MLESQFSHTLKRRIMFDQFLEKIDRVLKRIWGRSFRHEHFMNNLPDTEQVQYLMERLCNDDNSFALIRFGLYESMICYQFLEKQCGLRKEYSEYVREHIKMDAGMFSNDEKGMDMYAYFVISKLMIADVVGYWTDIPRLLVFKSFFQKRKDDINIDDIYPFPFWHRDVMPWWHRALSGKNVLIVSSFSKSIEKQYLYRSKIWDDPDILPDFNLITYQAIQTSGGGINDERGEFENWREAFDYMLNDILEIDFDIAMISCGGYGMPLALCLKEHGKKAIQWGGCLQLWFGILGNRWYRNPEIQPYINSYWKPPMEEEIPPFADQVDGGAYWCR